MSNIELIIRITGILTGCYVIARVMLWFLKAKLLEQRYKPGTLVYYEYSTTKTWSRKPSKCNLWKVENCFPYIDEVGIVPVDREFLKEISIFKVFYKQYVNVKEIRPITEMEKAIYL